MSEPIRLNEWRDLLAKLVSLRVGPPQESHDVNIVTKGEITKRAVYASATGEHVAEALVVDVRYDPHSRQSELLTKGGRFTVTLQLLTENGVVL